MRHPDQDADDAEVETLSCYSDNSQLPVYLSTTRTLSGFSSFGPSSSQGIISSADHSSNAASASTANTRTNNMKKKCAVSNCSRNAAHRNYCIAHWNEANQSSIATSSSTASSSANVGTVNMSKPLAPPLVSDSAFSLPLAPVPISSATSASSALPTATTSSAAVDNNRRTSAMINAEKLGLANTLLNKQPATNKRSSKVAGRGSSCFSAYAAAASDKPPAAILDSVSTPAIPENSAVEVRQQQDGDVLFPRSVQCAGWLWKRGRLNKAWQRRFFILDNDFMLYFPSPQVAGAEAKGLIDLRDMNISSAIDSEREFCFMLVGGRAAKEGRVFYLAVETPFEKDKWMRAISESIKLAKARKATVPVSPSIRFSDITPDETNIPPGFDFDSFNFTRSLWNQCSVDISLPLRVFELRLSKLKAQLKAKGVASNSLIKQFDSYSLEIASYRERLSNMMNSVFCPELFK